MAENGGVAADGAAPAPRRRLANMLSSFYTGDGSQQQEEQPDARSEMDKEGFDAKSHFDSVVNTSQTISDLLKSANSLDEEVRDLDGDMQMVVYENYSKFIRTADVTKEMKTSMESLKPDLKCLEDNFGRIASHQREVEESVSGRAQEINVLLQRQQVCSKLRLLLDLPDTLQQCLDQAQYRHACQAYKVCAPFLRQHRHVITFQRVMEDVEHQMGRIKKALEMRLRSAQLSIEDAIKSSVVLLDLGEDQAKVVKEYLRGRVAALQDALDKCMPALQQVAEAVSKDADGTILQEACSGAAAGYLPLLHSSLQGLRKLQGADFVAEGIEAVEGFVNARIEALFERITTYIERRRPPAPVVVDCVSALKEAMDPLVYFLPSLMPELSRAFAMRAVSFAMKATFLDATGRVISDLVRLHAECKHLQDAKSSGIDLALEEMQKTEQGLANHCSTAVGDCESLLRLIENDRAAGQQLVQNLQKQMLALFMTVIQVWRIYVEGDAVGGSDDGLQLPLLSGAEPFLQSVAALDFVGVFCLALVWIGRRMEDKAIEKTWACAQKVFGNTQVDIAELSPDPALAKHATAATEVAISHYVLVNGQRLAHFLRNSLQKRDWKSAREPQEPSLVVEMVFKELHSLDIHLGRILADPRKARGGNARRIFDRNKTSMEVEMERQWAKKQQVFAAVPVSRSGAVAGLLRIAFKALCEYAREQTFGNFGMQQIQVDSELLGELARDFVEADDASILSSLLGEVVDAAKQRCMDTKAKMLDSTMVEQLCDQKKKTLRPD